MKGSQLPIGVVLPTLNARAYLPAHLAQLRTWAEQVQEIIVVDSYSTDGTLELLEAQLSHPRQRLLQCPPGLYQSWNYGIEQITARFTYIATVGDTITAEGLEHLVAVATELQSDLVISRPEFFNAEGRPVSNKRWPVHDLLDWGPSQQPRRVDPWQVFLLATLEAPEGILGSSASNLYRTDTLKRLPFPTEYGHVGDTAWGIRHALHTSLAVTPKVFSRFVIHPNAGMTGDAEKELLVNRLFELARQTARDGLAKSPLPLGQERLLPVLEELPAALQKLRQCQELYDQARRQYWPWIFNPLAWQARIRRNRQRRRIRNLKQEIRRHFRLDLPCGLAQS